MRYGLKETGRDVPNRVSSRNNAPHRSPGWVTVGLVVAILSIVALPRTIPRGLGPVFIVASAVILVLLLFRQE
jgi:hypothetical protein